MHVISEEAIAFQPASAPKTLANELTRLFQDTIDYRNSVTDSPAKRIEAVYNYFIKQTAPKVIVVVEKYTGIKLSIAVPKFLMANWAVGMEFDGTDDVETLIRRYSGLLTNKNYGRYVGYKATLCKTQKELEEFSHSLNTTSGIVKAGMMEKHHFKAKLYFDVYGSFLIKETGAKACEPLTAPEITAVILHEIGHVLSFIEHAADIVFKKDVMQMATSRFFEQASDEEKLKYIGKASESIYPEAADAIAKLNTYIETKGEQKGYLTWSGIRILTSTIGLLLRALGWGCIHFVTGTIATAWTLVAGAHIKSITSLADGKSGDFYKSAMNSMYCEVLADEYVSRFGYGGHLATQMQKIYDWSKIICLGDMRMKQYTSVSFFGRLLPWVIYTTFYGDKTSPDYPTERQRYELMLTATLKAFKDEDVDDCILDDYYRSYNQIKKMLDNPSKTQRYTTFCNYLHDALNYIVRTPVELLFTGRFDREYERLYNQVQYLSNNELYALGYKLKTMNKGNN